MESGAQQRRTGRKPRNEREAPGQSEPFHFSSQFIAVPLRGDGPDEQKMGIPGFLKQIQKDFLIFLIINARDAENEFSLFRNMKFFADVSGVRFTELCRFDAVGQIENALSGVRLAEFRLFRAPDTEDGVCTADGVGAESGEAVNDAAVVEFPAHGTQKFAQFRGRNIRRAAVKSDD